jgi:hypothetical protein
MKKALLTTLFVVAVITFMQAQLGINADFSPRAELRHGYRVLPPEDARPAAHIHQRTRLGLNWRNENIRTRIAIQDVRVWGQEPQRQHNPSLSVHEAWAELLLNPTTSLKLGRQELGYDNQRFLGLVDWVPMGNKHDMLLYKKESGNRKFHLGNAFNQEYGSLDRNFETEYRINNYKYMGFAWFNTPVGQNSNLSLLAMAEGFQDAIDHRNLRVRGTWSAYFTQSVGQLNFMINPALQNGTTRNGNDILAWYLSAEAGIPIRGSMRSALGFEIFSGNKPGDTKYRAFDAPHGTGHAFNGYMDYFINIPVHTAGAGLVNPYLKNRFTLSERTILDADLHLFYLQNDYMHFGGDVKRYLGTEVDFTLSYRLTDVTRIIAGYSWMFGSETMEIVKGGSKNEPAYFAFVMLRIRPTFL